MDCEECGRHREGGGGPHHRRVHWYRRVGTELLRRGTIQCAGGGEYFLFYEKKTFIFKSS